MLSGTYMMEQKKSERETVLFPPLLVFCLKKKNSSAFHFIHFMHNRLRTKIAFLPFSSNLNWKIQVHAKDEEEKKYEITNFIIESFNFFFSLFSTKFEFPLKYDKFYFCSTNEKNSEEK